MPPLSPKPQVTPKQPGLLNPLKPAGTAKPFFLVPSAGKTPLSLFRLARCMRAPSPIYAFSYAGMDNDRDPHETIEAMAAHYLTELRGLQPGGPYYLGGHCLGGLVALEMAAQLEAQHEEIGVVVLLESIQPNTGNGRSEKSSALVEPDDGALEDTIKQIGSILNEQMKASMAQLPPALTSRYASIYRIHTAAYNRYLGSEVTAPLVLIRTRTYHDRVFEAWRGLSRSPFTHIIVPGDAVSMLKPPHVEVLASHLDHSLAEVGIR